MINLPLENITDIMLQLMPTIDEMFHSCYWRGTGFNCSDLIRLQRTEEGFCYSFNSKTSERSVNDSEFNPPVAGPNDMLIPLRNNAAGKMTGLELILKSLITEYSPVDTRSKGFNIMVHTPEDFPDISGSYKIYSEINQSSQISVSVSHIGADESIYRLGETDRKCFLYVERSAAQVNLPLYRSNSEDNCYSRCRLRTTREMCGCVPYYFDVEREGHDETEWKCCGIEHIQCLGKMDVLQRNTQPPKDEPGFPEWSVPVYMNCSCPHPCSFIGYTTEMKMFPKDYMESSLFPNAYMHIDIHYKERFAISYQRFMKYTVQDLLVTFGGMASLFLGCSLVSLMEIFCVIYKSLLMLKHKYTKVDTVSRKQQFMSCHRNHALHFSKLLYKPPYKKSSTVR
ncbi:sodium channel protein Nach-like [Sipha flava]|uniref:Sodium channel protein Nach-like n=2 Tax=Sipha flava TaxID=143950 RepID=A0A8B8GG27_9HEMI|nr:sodium channel protein Nach-like [Sipha flava]